MDRFSSASSPTLWCLVQRITANPMVNLSRAVMESVNCARRSVDRRLRGRAESPLCKPFEDAAAGPEVGNQRMVLLFSDEQRKHDASNSGLHFRWGNFRALSRMRSAASSTLGEVTPSQRLRMPCWPPWTSRCESGWNTASVML